MNHCISSFRDLDGADVQAHVVFGFPVRFTIIVAYRMVGPAADVGGVLGRAAGEFTNCRTAAAFRFQRKERLLAGLQPEPILSVLRALALGPEFLSGMGMDPADLGDDAFVRGVREVPRFVPATNTSQLGGAVDTTADMLLVLASDRDEPLEDDLIRWERRFKGVAKRIFIERCERLEENKEHFGFADGISQPTPRVLIDGTLVHGQMFPSSSPYASMFSHPGNRWTNAAQFLFPRDGCVRREGTCADWIANGSLLVLWRLTQFADAFSRFCQETADLLTSHGVDTDANGVAERIVGRDAGGRPLVHESADYDLLDSRSSALQRNYFEYDRSLPSLRLDDDGKFVPVRYSRSDPLGERCPLWAHIRKMNPRMQDTDRGGPDRTQAMQVLRRGITFRRNPSRDESEVGLVFMAYQTSIRQQFLALLSGWANSDAGPAAGGHDLLIGGLDGSRLRARLRDPDGDWLEFTAQNNWVLPTGAAFMFAPSVAFLRTLATS